MKLRVGNLLAQCPYCGSAEFAEPADEDRDLVCADCGGRASRQVVLDRLGDHASELARDTLARLKQERRSKRNKPG
jgi:transcription initiation factor TFIIIB Brf1 subunit/transcription initiation factor TFIIB